MQLRLIADVPLLNGQHTLYVLVAQPLAFLASQQLRRLEDVLNLTPVHLVPRQLIEVFVTEAVGFALGGGGEEIDPDVSA